MFQATHPGHYALDAHAEARVRNRSVAAQIQIPLKSIERQLVLLYPLFQQLVGSETLRATDYFPVTLRRQHVDTQGELGVLRVRLHVERLHRGRVAVHHDRAVELGGEIGLVGRTEVVSVGELLLDQAAGKGIVEHAYRLVVADSRKGRLHRLELGSIAPDHLQVQGPSAQHALHQKAQKLLRQRHQIIQRGIGHLRLHHPELRQVAPRLRLLGAKGGPERIHLAQRHRCAFDIQLAALREVRLVPEVLDGKQRAGSFAGGRSENRRVGKDKAVIVEKIPRRLDDFSANAQNC